MKVSAGPATLPGSRRARPRSGPPGRALRRDARRGLAPALAVPAALLACALLAACGGPGSVSATNAVAKEQTREQQAETRFQDFARCLREHGVDAEALSRPGGGHGIKISPGGVGPAATEAAERDCARYKPEAQRGTPSPQQKVELEEAAQRFARCMREHGVEVEASTAGGGVHITIQRHAGEGGPIPGSPSFRRAQSACQKQLPGAGPAGPG